MKTLRLLSTTLTTATALFISCQEPLEREYAAPTLLKTREIISVEKRTISTAAKTTVAAECLIVDPNPTNNELYLICVPENWNGELIVYAHGYVAPSVPELTFAEGEQYANLVSSLGFAYATTTYSGNGLHIQQGINDILALKDYAVNFLQQHRTTPSYVYLAGGSQGGAITALTMERHPNAFDGGFSLCGPCGDFEGQMNYYGDFRMVFDYYFKSIIKPSLTSLGLPYPDGIDNAPAALIANWQTVYVPIILQALQNYPQLTSKLLAVTRAPIDSADPSTIAQTVIATLWYDFFTIDDAKANIRGVIFNNTNRVYFGTGNFLEDLTLNRKIGRMIVRSDNGAYPIQSYITTGQLNVPMVMEHTIKDPIQLFILHQPVYRLKVLAAGKFYNFAAFPVNRYGHCNFTETEILLGLARLIVKVKGQAIFAGDISVADLTTDRFILSSSKVRIN